MRRKPMKFHSCAPPVRPLCRADLDVLYQRTRAIEARALQLRSITQRLLHSSLTKLQDSKRHLLQLERHPAAGFHF